MGDQERCGNCRRDIPAANYRMHTMHCARNIALCPVCDEPVPRGELEEHKQENHAKKHCPDCGASIEASKLEEHKTSLCEKRIEVCPYCALNQEMSEMEAHKAYCGSRTEKCEECKEIIMLKNWEMHIDSNHGFIKLKDEPGPKPSWEMEEEMKRRNNLKCDYMSSLYSTRPDPRYDDPRTTSTTTQRKNFTDTELFNNQDLYSSKRFATTASSSAAQASSTGQPCSSPVSAASTVRKSASSSIVSSALDRSTSSSRVSALAMSERRSSMKTEERRSSTRTEETVSSTLSKNTASIVAKVLANNKDVANAHVNGQSVDDEKLPCEFCEAMIPMYKLHTHQAECVNSSNVRGSTFTSYSRYSGLNRASTMREPSQSRDTSSSYSLNRASSMRETSQSRDTTYSLDRSSTTSRVNRFLRQSSTETPTESETPPSVNGCTPNRKVSPPNSNSIVNRLLGSSEQRRPSCRGESPPSYDREPATSSYMGRSSYLKEERDKEDRRGSTTSSKSSKKEPVVAGLYENDRDRENLRQSLAGLRKCPLDYADDPDNNDGSFFPCEFCGDPYPCEFLMRHQMSCDLNPQPVSSGSGFDYNSIKASVTQNLVESSMKGTAPSSVVPSSVVPEKRGGADADDERTEQILNNTRRLSRSNSVIERSYSRSNVRASSVSRTSSFADRSYGTRTNLGTSSSFAVADFTSAVRRSSVFDGYAGYSIYSSISEGLDQITYGGGRRNSITETNYSLSRRGSFSTRSDLPLAALQASLEANKATREEDISDRSERRSANDHVNGQASSYLQSSHHSHLTNGFSRQNSSQGESPKTIESPFGATSGSDLNRSESKKLRRRTSIKHSQSGYKLSKQVSFHDHAQVIGDEGAMAVDESGNPLPEKPKKKRTEAEKEARRKEKEEKRERKEAKRAARGQSKDRKCRSEGDVVPQLVQPPPQPTTPKNTVQGGELLQQVSQRLAEVERQQQQQPPPHLAPLPSSSLLPLDRQASNQPNQQASAPRNQESEPPSEASNHHNGHVDALTLKGEPAVPQSKRKISKGPPPKPPVDVVDDLVNLDDDPSGVTLREHSDGAKACSKRNSLDNKSVQTLAKDLAAECAKAYELMESSLSKLTNDFSIGPFGLTPKTKKKSFARPAPALK